MIKKVLLVVLVLLVIAVVFLYVRTRPSGDIDKYSQYFINDAAAPSDNSVRITFFGVSTILFDDGKTGVRFQVSGVRFQVSGFKFQVSGFKFQVSGFKDMVWGQ